jgi:hypothetical protein
VSNSGKRFFAPTLRDLFWLAAGIFLGVGLFVLMLEMTAYQSVVG